MIAKNHSFKFYILFSLIIVCMFAGNMSAYAQTDNAVYRQSFTSLDEVNSDFEAFFVKYTSGRSYAEEVGMLGGHLIIDNGFLKSVVYAEELAGNENNTANYSILTFTKQTYLNFEVSVDYKTGSDTYFWPAIAFRQSEKGKTFFDDGGTVFVQNEGKATLWGGKQVGGPYEGAAIAGYDKNATHNLRVTVQGNELSAYIDGVLALEKKLNSAFYQEGYISLISVNNSNTFSNFSIKVLQEPEIVAPPAHKPVPDADTSDSLDNLAKDRTNSKLLERQPDIIVPKQSSAILLIVVIAGIAVIGAAAMAVIFTKEKRKRM